MHDRAARPAYPAGRSCYLSRSRRNVEDFYPFILAVLIVSHLSVKIRQTTTDCRPTLPTEPEEVGTIRALFAEYSPCRTSGAPPGRLLLPLRSMFVDGTVVHETRSTANPADSNVISPLSQQITSVSRIMLDTSRGHHRSIVGSETRPLCPFEYTWEGLNGMIGGHGHFMTSPSLSD